MLVVRWVRSRCPGLLVAGGLSKCTHLGLVKLGVLKINHSC
jgi:hypothetical protein